jgi:hypothetical protein
LAIAAAFALAYGIAATSGAIAQTKRPAVKLKPSPPVGFSPMSVAVTAELTGGSNHDEDFYCASAEWNWDDGTASAETPTCPPYVPGKSEFRRRYIGQHTFRVSAGAANPNQVRPPAASVDTDMASRMPQGIQYKVRFALRKDGKTIANGETTVEVKVSPVTGPRSVP